MLVCERSYFLSADYDTANGDALSQQGGSEHSVSAEAARQGRSHRVFIIGLRREVMDVDCLPGYYSSADDRDTAQRHGILLT